MGLMVTLTVGVVAVAAAQEARAAEGRRGPQGGGREALEAPVPDPSHAREDVGFHFTNQCFVGQAGNWPLAPCYIDGVPSHLKGGGPDHPQAERCGWSRNRSGGILAALETSTLKDLG